MSEKIYQICASLSEISKHQLERLFSSISGRKDLVLHPDIIPPLEKICDAKWLKSNNIGKIYKINPEGPCVQYEAPSVIYLTYICNNTLKRIIDQIQLDNNNARGKYHIVHVPVGPHELDELLESHGIHEYTCTHSLQWLPIQLDTGLLTLEVPHVYRSLYVDKDLTYLPCFSRAIWQLCQVFGKSPVCLAIGERACAVKKQLESDLRILGQANARGQPALHALIILDRNVDYPSTLLLPGTYAALLSEVYRSKSGLVEYKDDGAAQGPEVIVDELTCAPIPPKQPIKLFLDSDKDKIYSTLKYRYFPEAMAHLVRQLKQAASTSTTFSAGQMSVADMKRFVATSLKTTELAKKHDRAAEAIIRAFGDRFERHKDAEYGIITGADRHEEFIQEALVTSYEPYESLRLFCLTNVTHGYPAAKSRTFLDTFLARHGYVHLPLRSRLIQADLMTTSGSDNTGASTEGHHHHHHRRVGSLWEAALGKTSFEQQAAKWKQLGTTRAGVAGGVGTSASAQDDLRNPTSPSYVFGGSYSPLVAQVVGALAAGARLQDLQEKLKVFANSELEAPNGFYPLRERTFLVVIIGGVTYSEMAALSLLEQMTGSTIIVLSDTVIGGNDIIDALLH